MYIPYQYIETEDFEAGFAQHYKDHVVPLAKNKEKHRTKRQLYHYTNIVTAVISGMGISFLIIKSAWYAKAAQGNRKSGNILLVPPMFFWWLLVHRPRRAYFQALKKDIVPKILEFFGNFEYAETGTINEEILLTHTGYHYLFNAFKCEDLIYFKKNGFDCTIIERTFWDVKTPSGKVFIYITSDQMFKLDAVIISKARKKRFKGVDKRLIRRRGIQYSATLNQEKFDNSFNVYTSDTRITQGLSDEFIDALLLLDKVFGDDGLVFSVKDNSVFIELESKGNFFEIGKCHNLPVANQADIKTFLHEFYIAIQLVDIITKTLCDDDEDTSKEIAVDTIPKSKHHITRSATTYENETMIWSGRVSSDNKDK